MAEGAVSDTTVAHEIADGAAAEEFERVLRAALPAVSRAPLHPMDRLADLGLTSLGIVQLVVELEDAYEVDFPDEMITAVTFASVGSLWEALHTLLHDQ